MNRRQLLQAFLGLPAAALACSSRASRPPLPAGDFAFRRERLGHRIRDGGAVEPPADAWQDVEVAIVGAGAAGLTAAWRLARAGVTDIAVLELGKAAGGTARSGRDAVGQHPWGAHYITAPMAHNRALIALLSEMGVVSSDGIAAGPGEPAIAEQFLCREPAERVFYRGRWYEGTYLGAGASRADRQQRAQFEGEISRWAAVRDSQGRRAFALPRAAGSVAPEVVALDGMSMAQWMDARGFDSPRLRWYVDYGCRDDYGCSMADVSAWAGIFYYAARVSNTASDYQPVITWPEGNGRIIAHLSQGLGERLRLGWAVADLRQDDNRVELRCLTEEGKTARGLRAKHVVFAAPQFLRRFILQEERRDTPAFLDEFQYGAWMVANLQLRERLSHMGFEQAWDNVLYDSPALGYVVSTHQRGLDHGPTTLTYYYPVLESDVRAGRKRLLAIDWSGWAEVVLSDLERAHPDIRHKTTRIDVARWGHAMVRPRPGFACGAARLAAAAPRGRVHFAHTDLSALALFEESFYHGIRAAEELLGARGAIVESML